MSDAVTASVIETPKPERPTLYLVLDQNNVLRAVSTSQSNAGFEARGIAHSLLLEVPGTAAQREYAAWCGKVMTLATWASRQQEAYIGSSLMEVVNAIFAGLPKETP